MGLEPTTGVRKTRPTGRRQQQGRALHPHPARTLPYAYSSYTNEPARAQPLRDALDSYNRYRPNRLLSGQTPLQRARIEALEQAADAIVAIADIATVVEQRHGLEMPRGYAPRCRCRSHGAKRRSRPPQPS